MANKKRLFKWILVLFDSTNKNNIFKIWEFNTMKELSYVIGMDSQVVSNYYHKLINSRENLKYCSIYQSSHGIFCE